MRVAAIGGRWARTFSCHYVRFRRQHCSHDLGQVLFQPRGNQFLDEKRLDAELDRVSFPNQVGVFSASDFSRYEVHFRDG
jgi:hypothetical protein